MRRYFIGLIILTIVMVLMAFATKWGGMEFFAPLPVWILPAAVLYFGAVSAVQYWLTINGMNKRPKAFVQSFLATTVAVLFIHIVVLVGGMLTNPAGGKRFAVAFLILYVVYTFYMIASIVFYIRQAGKDK